MAMLSYDILRSIFEDFEPQEVRQNVDIEAIKADAHRAWRELSFMALVCKTWTPPAQAALYKTAYAMIDLLSLRGAPTMEDRYAQFVRTMMTSPHLWTLLRHVFISYGRGCFMGGTLEECGWLARLPEHSLMSCRYHANTVHPPVVAALQTSAVRTVQRLRLATIITPAVLRAVGAMAQLEHLDLEAAHWYPEYARGGRPLVDYAETTAKADFPLLTHAALTDHTGCPFYNTRGAGFVAGVLASPLLVSLTVTLSTSFATAGRIVTFARELLCVSPRLRELRVQNAPDAGVPVSNMSLNLLSLDRVEPLNPLGLSAEFLDTLVLRFPALETLCCLQGTFTGRLFRHLPRTLRELKLEVPRRDWFLHEDALVEWIGSASLKGNALASVCLVPSIAGDPLAVRVAQACAKCGVLYLEV
ncbi:hypothetical protein C8Q80DRAFT_4993 [Daedaleopsis nitida]|nr:hypothetical protein C8Q80DRAFT_4993 [Daedaleopsis nitida]